MISGKELSGPWRLPAGGGQLDVRGSVLVTSELLLATAGVNCAAWGTGLIGNLAVIRAGDGGTSITGIIGFSRSDFLTVTEGPKLNSSEVDKPLVITGST